MHLRRRISENDRVFIKGTNERDASLSERSNSVLPGNQNHWHIVEIPTSFDPQSARSRLADLELYKNLSILEAVACH